MKKIVFLVALLVIPVVCAQLDWTITGLRCGNKILDQFELCEDDVEETKCDHLGTILKIDTACDTEHCTCLPRVNKAFCGNNIREGVELCDGSAEDKCAEFGALINISLVCNPKTCGCTINETLPADYSPGTVEELLNQSQSASVCGDKKVERDEDCDPPNTLCTVRGDPGVCNDKCKCVLPEMLGVEEPVEETVESNVSENVTAEVVSDEVLPEVVPENVTAPEVKEPGFFGKIWAWIVSLFS